MKNKGCYICRRLTDKFYIVTTPTGEKYKTCQYCMTLINSFAKTGEKINEAMSSENN